MSMCWWWYVNECVLCVCVCMYCADSSVLALMWMVLGADRLVLFCGPAGSRSGHKCSSQVKLLLQEENSFLLNIEIFDKSPFCWLKKMR